MFATTFHSNIERPTPLVLVIGATGGIGGAVARELLGQGWRVRALSRQADMAQRVQAGGASCRGLAGVEWVQGDAMQDSDMMRAAQGVDFIVHGANPPRYARWRELALPMLVNAIEAARASGARLILPGNVYNFGPDAGELVAEGSPQHPLTRKGAVRVEMEQRLREAAADARRPVRSLVLRAGDFFGGHAPSSWFGTLLVKPGKPLRQVVYPGVPEVGHAWAYLPDVARTMVQLMALDKAEPGRLAPCEVLHFGGHWLPRGIDMAEAIRRAAGQPGLPIKPLFWPLMTALSPFVEVLREMREMRYLWQVPLQLDNRKLVSLLGAEPHTPLDDAIHATLVALGCLDHAGLADKASSPLRKAA
jgi:nucleoside-diphosphate-sugar epimerase